MEHDTAQCQLQLLILALKHTFRDRVNRFKLKKHFEIQALHDHAVHFGHDDFFLCLDIFINAKKLILGRRRDFLFD